MSEPVKKQAKRSKQVNPKFDMTEAQRIGMEQCLRTPESKEFLAMFFKGLDAFDVLSDINMLLGQSVAYDMFWRMRRANRKTALAFLCEFIIEGEEEDDGKRTDDGEDDDNDGRRIPVKRPDQR